MNENGPRAVIDRSIWSFIHHYICIYSICICIYIEHTEDSLHVGKRVFWILQDRMNYKHWVGVILIVIAMPLPPLFTCPLMLANGKNDCARCEFNPLICYKILQLLVEANVALFRISTTTMFLFSWIASSQRRMYETSSLKRASQPGTLALNKFARFLLEFFQIHKADQTGENVIPWWLQKYFIWIITSVRISSMYFHQKTYVLSEYCRNNHYIHYYDHIVQELLFSIYWNDWYYFWEKNMYVMLCCCKRYFMTDTSESPKRGEEEDKHLAWNQENMRINDELKEECVWG